MDKIKYIFLGIQNAFSSVELSDFNIKKYSEISKDIYNKRIGYINETFKKESNHTSK
ncbi:MAG: hypothetical protein SPH77_00795 [Campylobacter sp.]|uniref:hypothetical protein n=1 Tax=Campylobacter sp. TaxID=205 RepID=UPI0029734E09|nr:hypothetical protein [Campylobacter sp.]MDD7599568.1 hypothetical protein [Campylobacteraceae bacterium]MCI6177878.1 hypothetical protein [Campylobacter sp.]MCI7501798.1 hypothetical protein [Campylobacter sp.]MDD7741281.1 hypothetical protein [Campylobacteraceae bacterium]MDY4120954.1 hypothetical protein [Campylobacter sp.]